MCLRVDARTSSILLSLVIMAIPCCRWFFSLFGVFCVSFFLPLEILITLNALFVLTN